MRLAFKQSIVARQPNDLTVAWAQRVARQHDDDIVVFAVIINTVDVGTTTRISLTVQHNKPEKLAQHWFVKLPSLAWQARLITALPRLLHTEVRFYNELAPSLSVRLPPFLAAQSQLGQGATLVLADVRSFGAIPGKPQDELSFTDARSVIKQLAHFHARFWHTKSRQHEHKWLAGPIRRLEDSLGTALAVPLMKRGLRLAGHLVPQAAHAPAMRYAKNRRAAMRFLSQGPQTLVHHDCHPGNLFWSHAKPGLLDWQLVRFGEGISDVAYFLATALTPENRRLHEAQLLAIYAQTLLEHGITDIDLSQLFSRYRAHLIYPFEAMIVTLAIGGMMDLESNQVLISRTAAAVIDLEAFSALPIS